MAPVEPPVTDSPILNEPVIPTGAAEICTLAVVYPLPALSISSNATLLYPDPSPVILSAVNFPFVNVGINVGATPPEFGALIAIVALSSS